MSILSGFKISSFSRQIAKTLVVAILSCGLVTSISNATDKPEQESIFWTTSAMEAVELDRPSPISTKEDLKRLSKIQLQAAKGEYEAFQIVIQSPSADLREVDVVVSDLTSADGSVIDKENITLYRQHYIKLDRPSYDGWLANPTKGAGLYADALIPFVDPNTGEDIKDAELDAVPFNLEAGKNQPIWVDVFVPRSAKPGNYRGKFSVTSDRGISSGQIELKVWNFELPVQPSLDSFFDIWLDRGIEAQTLLLKHRLMSSQRIEYPNRAKAFKELGVKSVRLPFWSGANYNTCKMNPPPSVAELKAEAEQYSGERSLYVFSVDEIDLCPDLEKPLKEWGQNIHQAGLKHFAVMKPKPALYKAIDIWVVNPLMYAEARTEIARAKAQGDEIWFYTGYSTDYSPLWHLDSAPINFRIAQGWIAQSLDLQGVMLARADTWTANPWSEVPIYSQGEIDYPGIEMLFYPGDKVGLQQVVPSIRLKRLREGMEDYEYTEILKNMGYGEWAMNVVRGVGKNWREWTKDPQFLINARQKLGEKIDCVKTRA